MALQTTMLDLVATLTRMTPSEADVVATVAYLVNAGLVELTGSFRGQRFALADVPVSRAA